MHSQSDSCKLTQLSDSDGSMMPLTEHLCFAASMLVVERQMQSAAQNTCV
jgi:hypothetical protein